MKSAALSSFANKIKNLCEAGGPTPSQYPQIDEEISLLFAELQAGKIDQAEIRAILDDLGAAFTPETMQGLALRKPRGYAGDFEMIEKIYSEHTSRKDNLKNWDIYFHSRHAPKAVRNRKLYFHNILDGLPKSSRVLKLGCGPGRGMYEWLSRNPNKQIEFECVDVDADAIEYAMNLNKRFSKQVSFNHVNVFKFTPPPESKFDLVWAAGLFDYFDDRTFAMLGKRFFRNLNSGGELVIGNFSTANPTRPYMEIFGEWYLHHRTPETLMSLGSTISERATSRVDMEPEGVNLFLHIRQA